ncbi:MAG TPA: HAMP domain-containing histidine kinase [Candidatus Faeciplasma avium]|uniref:histidine kinase n=1 Tax=Candidatus Faeciplasma avium TaxID=2840798 RepID=A0A9D1T3R2_9FIRM|nr:HAMP domain-containing histidine kinase [Candidatus Faeciplasma avium]
MTTSTDKRQRPHDTAPTLRSTVWLYFSVFTLVILILIWFFQIVTLDKYYELSKRRKIVRTSMKISSVFDDESPKSVEELVEELAYKNGMAIAITDWNGNIIVSSDYMSGQSVFLKENSYLLFEYRNRLQKDSDSAIYEVFQNERFGTTELLYGNILSYRSITAPGYLLFINAALEPIGSTEEIIKEQFVIITVITFIIALLITTALSARISGPFTNITASASRLAAGDYSTHFEAGSYLEINELADTLNYAATEISKVDSLRNELIANVSHDLRTPLTMIKAYAEMIRDLSGDNPEKRSEHLAVIIDEADRLSELVSSLMELSKLQSKGSELKREWFYCHEFLNDILSRYTVLQESKGFELRLETDSDLRLYADRAKLSQVMFNFINNAVNYSGDSRLIIVRQKNLPHAVRIEIQDFGLGIPKEKLPLIFDRYYRVERTKRDIVGTGLGLSIVKEILEQHGYRFGVSSELGSGSTFWFEIKLGQEREDEGSKKGTKLHS